MPTGSIPDFRLSSITRFCRSSTRTFFGHAHHSYNFLVFLRSFAFGKLASAPISNKICFWPSLQTIYRLMLAWIYGDSPTKNFLKLEWFAMYPEKFTFCEILSIMPSRRRFVLMKSTLRDFPQGNRPQKHFFNCGLKVAA